MISLLEEVKGEVALLQDMRIQALAYFEKSIKLVIKESGKNNAFYGTLLTDKADVYRQQGDYKSALAIYNESEAVFKKLKKTKDVTYSSLMLSMGLCYDSLGHSHQTELYIKRSENIRKKLKNKNDYSMASYYQNIAYLFFNKDDLKNTRVYITKSKKVFQQYKLKNTISYANLLSLEARILYNKDKLKESEKIYKEVLKIKKGLGLDSSTSYSRTLLYLGMIKEQSDKKAARTLYMKARDILKKNKKSISDDYVSVLQRLAGIESKTSSALKYYSEAKGILKKLNLIDSKQYSILLYNMGFNYSKQGDYKNALSHYQESLSVLQKNKLDDVKLKIGLYSSIGHNNYKLGQYTRAVKMYQQAVSLNKSPGEKANIEIQLAQIYNRELKDPATALAYYQSAIKNYRVAKDTEGESYASALRDYGHLLSRSNPQEAINYLTAAQALFKKLKLDTDDQIWTVYYLASTYEANNLAKKAEEKYLELLTLTKNNPELDNLKSTAYLQLGNIAYTKKDMVSAKKYYQSTLVLQKKGDSDYVDIKIYLLSRISYINMNKKEYKSAIEMMNGLVEVYKTYKVKDPESLANNYLNIGYAWSQLKKPDNAIVEYLNCKNILEKEKLKSTKLYKMVLNNLSASYYNSGDRINAKKYQDLAEKL